MLFSDIASFAHWRLHETRLFNRGCKLAEGLFAAFLTLSCSQPAKQMQETRPGPAPQSVALPHPAPQAPAPVADEHMSSWPNAP
jgi:hypothetical protein